ncbi:MAG: hypothetical protein ACREDT_04725 [Methylocella sp.]
MPTIFGGARGRSPCNPLPLFPLRGKNDRGLNTVSQQIGHLQKGTLCKCKSKFYTFDVPDDNRFMTIGEYDKSNFHYGE